MIKGPHDVDHRIDVTGRHPDPGIRANLIHRGTGPVTTRNRAAHRLQQGNAEPFVNRYIEIPGRMLIQREQLRFTDLFQVQNAGSAVLP